MENNRYAKDTVRRNNGVQWKRFSVFVDGKLFRQNLRQTSAEAMVAEIRDNWLTGKTAESIVAVQRYSPEELNNLYGTEAFAESEAQIDGTYRARITGDTDFCQVKVEDGTLFIKDYNETEWTVM